MARLTEEQVQLLLDKNFANLATLRSDGTPHVTPVWVDWDGESIVLNTAYGRAKERHIRRDPRVGVEIFAQDNPYRYLSVNGTAQLEDEGADAHIDKLAQKYFGVAVYPSREPGERRVIVKVRPERVHASGFDR